MRIEILFLKHVPINYNNSFKVLDTKGPMKKKPAYKLQLWDFIPFAGPLDYESRNSNVQGGDSENDFVKVRKFWLTQYNRVCTTALVVGGAVGLAKLIRK